MVRCEYVEEREGERRGRERTSLTSMVKVGKPEVWLAGTGKLHETKQSTTLSDPLKKESDTHKPELNPLIEVHGSLNDDCTTEWFFCWNWNSTLSPGFAFKKSGV